MSDLTTQCERTLEYRSRGYVADARDYARWILRLAHANAEERQRMLRELDGKPFKPEDRAAPRDIDTDTAT